MIYIAVRAFIDDVAHNFDGNVWWPAEDAALLLDGADALVSPPNISIFPLRADLVPLLA